MSQKWQSYGLFDNSQVVLHLRRLVVLLFASQVAQGLSLCCSRHLLERVGTITKSKPFSFTQRCKFIDDRNLN